VIAWGTIVDPSSDTLGRRVGILSAYEGHPQRVGRVLADSTWHHHFDINLRGLPGNPARPGFVTPGTDDWIVTARKIEHFFVNAAIWLAPPDKQAAMRAAAWWPIIFSDIILESLDQTKFSYHLGRQAYDALGRYAPQCVVFGWIWELVPVKLRRELPKFIDQGDPPPYLEYVAGVATRQLIERFGADINALPSEPPSHEEISEALQGASRQAMVELMEHVEDNLKHVRRWSELT
jgi:hypothetical protein